ATISISPTRSSELLRILSCGSAVCTMTLGFFGFVTSTAVTFVGADSCASHSTRRRSRVIWMAIPSPTLPKPSSGWCASRRIFAAGIAIALELHRRGWHLAAGVERRQLRRRILPDEEHRALGRESAMPDVGRHGGALPRLHRHPRADGAGVAVLDLPLDLVAELHEPLHAIVAVDDRQDVLLGRRAVEARLADGHDRRIPRHVRA